MHIGLKKEN